MRELARGGGGGELSRPPALHPSPPPLAQNVAVPLTGDAAAAKKFAADVGALRAKVGAPDPADLVAATVEHGLKAAGGDVRRFLAGLASAGEGGGVDEALIADLGAALDAAEKEGGASLAGGGDGSPAAAKAWAAFAAKVAALAKAKGLDDVARVREGAAVASAADALASLRGAAADAVEAAARRDGLAAGEVDLGALKPKW